MARSSILAGRTISDLLASILCGTIVVLTGYVIGWRPGNGILGVVAGLAVAVLFAYAMSWLTACVGLAVERSGVGAGHRADLILFPLAFVSSCFVPTAGPARTGCRSIAEWNPVSAVAGCVPRAVRQPEPGRGLPAPSRAAPGADVVHLDRRDPGHLRADEHPPPAQPHGGLNADHHRARPGSRRGSPPPARRARNGTGQRRDHELVGGGAEVGAGQEHERIDRIDVVADERGAEGTEVVRHLLDQLRRHVAGTGGESNRGRRRNVTTGELVGDLGAHVRARAGALEQRPVGPQVDPQTQSPGHVRQCQQTDQHGTWGAGDDVAGEQQQPRSRCHEIQRPGRDTGREHGDHPPAPPARRRQRDPCEIVCGEDTIETPSDTYRPYVETDGLSVESRERSTRSGASTAAPTVARTLALTERDGALQRRRSSTNSNSGVDGRVGAPQRQRSQRRRSASSVASRRADVEWVWARRRRRGRRPTTARGRGRGAPRVPARCGRLRGRSRRRGACSAR